MRIVIIGYGNPSRQDDGVGFQLVSLLRERWGLAPLDWLAEPDAYGPDTVRLGQVDVRVFWLQQLDFALADDLAGIDRLILVDCHVGGPERWTQEIEPDPMVGPTTHVLTPQNLLHLTRTAHGRAPRCRLHSLRGTRFEFGDDLAPELLARVAVLADELEAEIRSCTS